MPDHGACERRFDDGGSSYPCKHNFLGTFIAVQSILAGFFNIAMIPQGQKIVTQARGVPLRAPIHALALALTPPAVHARRAWPPRPSCA